LARDRLRSGDGGAVVAMSARSELLIIAGAVLLGLALAFIGSWLAG
jgi:hypothetical protein